jgi:hypothetical protein
MARSLIQSGWLLVRRLRRGAMLHVLLASLVLLVNSGCISALAVEIDDQVADEQLEEEESGFSLCSSSPRAARRNTNVLAVSARVAEVRDEFFSSPRPVLTGHLLANGMHAPLRC